MKRIALALWLIASCLFGQEIKIVGPSTPIPLNDDAVFSVLGLSESELPKVSYVAIPSDGTRIRTNRPWSGLPELWFRSSKPGKYTIEITLNGWRAHLDAALQAAKQAEPNDPLTAKLEALVAEYVAAKPIRTGTASVEVAGQVPPPVPPDPIPIYPGRKRVVILLERGTTTPDQARLITSLQGGMSAASKYLVSKQHLLNVLDDDHPQAQPWLPKLGTVQIPAVIIQDVSSGAFVVASLPVTADAVIELVKRNGG